MTTQAIQETGWEPGMNISHHVTRKCSCLANP